MPRFYPAGSSAGDLLTRYSERLPAVELNNTFYQQPTAAKVAAWRDATPADFRFVVKAQRGGSFRALNGNVEAGLPWLTGPYRAFGRQLGCVLFRVPAGVTRNDERLAALLAAWPADLPLTLEFQDPSWHVDETFAALIGAGAAWCTTDQPEADTPPTLRRTGPFLYLRLRRDDYDAAAIEAWAGRLQPFVEDGLDAFVFFRHDEVGRGGELALELRAAVERGRR
ncbi:MAG: DUF72 domain-containing protein [Chloroflexi bacterium]|nr:DUF72 domain-containing protein [Chloroflexota bacterium]